MKKILWTCFFMIMISTQTFASEEDLIKVQGTIMNLDSKGNRMVVNERLFVWDLETKFYDSKGSPISADRFNAKAWVYIQAEENKAKKRIVIKKIYLLPKYVGKKERHLYSFME